jgi:hypothetical protein
MHRHLNQWGYWRYCFPAGAIRETEEQVCGPLGSAVEFGPTAVRLFWWISLESDPEQLLAHLCPCRPAELFNGSRYGLHLLTFSYLSALSGTVECDPASCAEVICTLSLL